MWEQEVQVTVPQSECIINNNPIISTFLFLFYLSRREREAATFKRGPKKKTDQLQQQSSSGGRSTRDRRLSTSSSSEGDSDDGESGSSSSSSSSSSSDEETEKEPVTTTAPPAAAPPPPITAKEPEKKVIEKPLSSPPSCRAAATAAGPKIASAFNARADRSISASQTSSNDSKNNKSDLAKEKKKDKEKEKEKEKDKEKDSAGTKRKAEVLSDNGRVGVTISTTSLDRSRSPRSPSGHNGSSPLSPTAKVPRLAPTTPTRPSPPTDPAAATNTTTLTAVVGNPTTITKEPHVTLSISLSPNGEAVARPGLDWRERSNQQQHNNSSPQQPTPQRSLSQDEQSAKIALLSLQRGANKYSPSSPASRSSSPTRPAPVLSPALPGESAHPPSSSGSLNSSKRSEQNNTGGSLSDQENVNLNGHGPNGRKLTSAPSSTDHLLTPSLDYWHRKNPLVDQIFITDVTVNMMTVTIRECKTVSGFFRHRPNGAASSSAENGNTTDSAEADGK